jgi:hypothetical protein
MGDLLIAQALNIGEDNCQTLVLGEMRQPFTEEPAQFPAQGIILGRFGIIGLRKVTGLQQQSV